MLHDLGFQDSDSKNSGSKLGWLLVKRFTGKLDGVQMADLLITRDLRSSAQSAAKRGFPLRVLRSSVFQRFCLSILAISFDPRSSALNQR